jgi:hypothetical protein
MLPSSGSGGHAGVKLGMMPTLHFQGSQIAFLFQPVLAIA